MGSKLNHDCFQNVFEYLESDQRTLFNCILVNSSWFEISIPYLWENPFSIVHRKGAANSKKLLKTIISMFPFDECTKGRLNSCKYYKVTYHSYEQSFHNYLNYMKIFKSVEFHEFIDKCSRVPPWKYNNIKKLNESTISSILTHHIYNIIFKNCTRIRQFALFNISNMTIQNNSFNNLSNLCYLEVGEIYHLGKIFCDCKKIKKFVIHLRNGWLNSPLLISFLKIQQGLKAIHFFNRFKYQSNPIPKELLLQIQSIEELGMEKLMLPYQQLNTLSKLKHLEIILLRWHPQTVATFRNVLCPLLEVLKFQDGIPPLDVLAEFIENTKGHLQCFYIKDLYQNYYHDTQLLLESITKSCPKLNSLSTVINIKKDLSHLENLLITCNELKNFTLMSIDSMNRSLLQKQLKIINENWDVIHKQCNNRRDRVVERVRFNKYQIKCINELILD